MISNGTTFKVVVCHDIATFAANHQALGFQLRVNFFVLADVSGGSVQQIEIVPYGMAVFSAPQADVWRMQGKQSSVKHEEELLARPSKTGADFSDRFLKYGGVVRVVWGDQSTVDTLENALSVGITETTDFALRSNNFEDVEHKFVYLKVAETKEGRYDFRVKFGNPTLEFGTRYLARIAAKSLVDRRLGKAKYFLFSNAPRPVAGRLFEAVALELLLNHSETTVFPIESLDGKEEKQTTPSLSNMIDNNKKQFKPSPPTLVNFRNEGDVIVAVTEALKAHSHVLALPRSTEYAGCDGIYAWNEGDQQKKAFLLQAAVDPKGLS